jgi:hypothetical protein
MLGVEPGATSAAIDAGLDEAEKFAVDKTAQAQSYAVSIAKEGVSWYRWLTGT